MQTQLSLIIPSTPPQQLPQAQRKKKKIIYIAKKLTLDLQGIQSSP